MNSLVRLAIVFLFVVVSSRPAHFVGINPALGAEAGSDWGRLVQSIKVVKFKAGMKIKLVEGQAVRFSGTVQEWCGKANSGIRVVEGTGTIHSQSPTGEVVTMNQKGQYGSVSQKYIGDDAFFVAGNTPTQIVLISADSKTLKQDCGE